MDLENSLLGLMSRDELEAELAGRIEKFHGLLTREVALRLLAKERGLLKKEEKFTSISEIEKGQSKICTRGKVKKVWPVATYSSGKRSRTIEIQDENASMPLILWNEDAEKGKDLRRGDSLSIRGAYERNNELHLGYSGQMKLSGRSEFASLDNLIDGEYVHVRGTIGKVEGADRFVRGASAREGFSFFITDGKKEIRCVIWNGIDRGFRLSAGDEIILENALFNDGEIGISDEGRILSRRKENMLLGKVESLECDGETVSVKVGGREGRMDRENALKFLGVEIADDISLQTVAMLKKDSMLSSNVALKAREKSGHFIIQG